MPRNDEREKAVRQLYAYIRFALRSGSLVAGYDACVGACMKGTVHVLAVTTDLSPRTARKLSNKCSGLVPIVILGSSAEVGNETGLANKKIIGVMNENLAEAIVKCHGMAAKG